MNLIEEHKRVTSRRADLFARVAISFRAGRYPFHENSPSRWKFAFSVSRTSIALTRECNTKFEIFPLDFDGTEHERDLLSKIAKQLLDCRVHVAKMEEFVSRSRERNREGMEACYEES